MNGELFRLTQMMLEIRASGQLNDANILVTRYCAVARQRLYSRELRVEAQWDVGLTKAEKRLVYGLARDLMALDHAGGRFGQARPGDHPGLTREELLADPQPPESGKPDQS